MKIWPLDEIAVDNQGLYISPADLRAGLDRCAASPSSARKWTSPLELHLRWHLAPAIEIARAAEEYQPM